MCNTAKSEMKVCSRSYLSKYDTWNRQGINCFFAGRTGWQCGVPYLLRSLCVSADCKAQPVLDFLRGFGLLDWNRFLPVYTNLSDKQRDDSVVFCSRCFGRRSGYASPSLQICEKIYCETKEKRVR